jgi:hypothetical protein
MQTDQFKLFLEKEFKDTFKGKEKLTIGAINSRISRAARIERELNIMLEDFTDSKENLRDLKKKIRDNYSSNVAAALYNTATRYYKFKHSEDPERKYREYLKL